MLFICYPKCSTCAKARTWLTEQGCVFTERDIKTENPTAEELRHWHAVSGLPLRRFFNTSGMLYREQGLSAKLPSMSEEDMLSLLATDGMLVKRPLLIDGDAILVGFRQAEWEARLHTERNDHE